MRTLSVALAVLVACGAGTVRADKITIQAESYSSSHNIDLDAIRAVGGTLYGLGYPGEWTQYTFDARAFGVYEALMLCWGELNVQYTLRLAIHDGSGVGDQTITFSFTGKGDCNH